MMMMSLIVKLFVQLRGEFLKETKVCTVISPRPGPSSAADGDDAQDTLVTKQVTTIPVIRSHSVADTLTRQAR
jgi:hypothetical protein